MKKRPKKISLHLRYAGLAEIRLKEQWLVVLNAVQDTTAKDIRLAAFLILKNVSVALAQLLILLKDELILHIF